MSVSSGASNASDRSSDSLDDALEYVLKVLESDEPLDRERILARFPRWARDLETFIDNWLVMEQRTAQLSVSEELDFELASDGMRGKIIGDYELLDLISSGGMGVVYRARQVSLGRIVALKMVLNAVRDKTRFRIEAEAAASLHHANIVAIHEVGEFEGQPFLSMQFISGGNLQDHLKPGPMAPRAAAALVRTIAVAVHYAHQRGILHRDLKPANVLLDAERRPYVSDFGLAKQMGNSVELTKSGAIIGTPGYMAPEQAMGQVKSITVAADVYGLGAILYTALTGHAPFKTDSDLLTLRKVIEEPPVSPRVSRPELDRNLETICLKCLEKTPASRYGSARQLAEDLTRYLQSEPVIARPIGFFERRWRWCARNPSMAVTAFFAGLMLSAVVLISLGFAWREYSSQMDAEFAAIRETAMQEAVKLAQVDAEAKNQKAQQAVAELYTSNGLWAARTNLFGESLLWFARAASLAGLPQEDLERSRTRCFSWIAQCPKPIAALPLQSPLSASSFQKDWLNWKLSPQSSEVMFLSGNDFGVWDFRDNEIWRPAGKDLQVSSSTWSHDGKLMAIGASNGELRLLDSKSKATKEAIYLDGAINFIAFSANGKRVAVCTQDKITILKSADLSIDQVVSSRASCLSIVFSNDDTKVSVVRTDGKAVLYGIDEGTMQMKCEVPCYLPPKNSFTKVFSPEFSNDSASWFVRTSERRARVFECSTGKPTIPEIVTGTTYSVSLSQGLDFFVVGGDSYARIQSIKWKDNVPSFVRHDYRLSHDEAVTGLAFGGKRILATAGRDRVVHLWRVRERDRPSGFFNERDIPLATLVHTNDIDGILFSNDGRLLITIQRDGLIRVWQVPSFEPPGYVAKVPLGGTTIKMSGTDQWLIAGSSHWGSNVVNASLRRLKDGVVVCETPLNGLKDRGHLLDAATTKERDKLISLHANTSRSSQTMSSQDSTAGSIVLWKFLEGKSLGPILPVNAEPRSVVLHPSEETAAVLLVDKSVLVIDLNEPAVIATLNGKRTDQPIDQDTGLRPIQYRNGQLQFNNEGSLLFSWGIGKGFRVWNWSTRQPQFSTDFAENWSVRYFAISPDGKRIALSVEEANRVVVVDCADGRITREFPMADKIRSVEFSTNGKELLVACEDHRAYLIDVDQAVRLKMDFVHDKSVVDACFSPDGQSIATLTSDMRVHFWRIQDRQWSMSPMPAPAGTQEIIYSPDSQFLCTMGMGKEPFPNNEVRILDLNAFDSKRELDLQYPLLLGELLASKSVGEAGLVGLTTAEWMVRWEDYQSRFLK